MKKNKTISKKQNNKNTIKDILKFQDKRFKNKKELPAIEFKDLTIDFGETIAVNNLNLSIKKGQLVTLLGPSGCGKTTTLNAIAGLLQPTSGRIIFNGKDVTKFSPQKRKLGLVFQNYALYPHMTAYKNIAFPLKNDVNWKNKVVKKNQLAQNEIDSIIFKANGASESKINQLKKLLLNIYDVKREVGAYYNELSSSLFKEIEEAKTNIAIEKAHYSSKRANINKKTLIKYEKLSKEFKNFKKNNKGNKEKNLKAKNNLKLKIKKLKEKHKDDIAETKTKFLKLIKAKKEAYLKIKKDVKLSPNYKKYLEAKNNLKTMPKEVALNYKEFFKSMKEEYTLDRTKLLNDQQKQINELSTKILPIKTVIHNAVMEVANKVDITNNLNKYPTKMSGGQQQRVAIARGIVKKPDVLLMDEPLSNLDAKLRIETRNWIRNIQKELGITLVFVTHDQEEAMSISDTVICLSNGRVQQIGAPMELYDKPNNIFVATFLGMPEMKIFEATVDKTNIKIGSNIICKKPKKYKHSKILVGIRGEHFLQTTKGIPAKISAIEYLGREIQANVNIENQGKARVFLNPNKKYNIGEKINLKFPNEKLIHLFNTETKERIEDV